MDAKETNLFIYIIAAVILVGIIIIYFFISMIRQQRRLLEIKEENLRVELTSIERERTRIAEDLHDELGPLVSAIKLKVSSFELLDGVDKQQQVKTDQHLNDLGRRLREISFNLMPVTLQRKGLVAALQELASYTTNHHGLKIEFAADTISLPNDTYAVHLYRMAQEIVHNTIKHAKATLLSLELKQNADTLILTTRDNGVGFDLVKARTDGGLGLRSLAVRADFLGGTIHVESKEGVGTGYQIEIPIGS